MKAPIASEEEVNDSWYTDSSSQYSDYIQSEDGPTEGGLVKALVEEAKADAKAAIDHYAKKANKEVDQVFDNLYYDIKDSVPLDDKKTTGRKKWIPCLKCKLDMLVIFCGSVSSSKK